MWWQHIERKNEKVGYRHHLRRITKSCMPILFIVDDTISSKTIPSSKASHPIEAASFHFSHLKRKQDYGHQTVSVMLSCNGITLNYAIVMYEKSVSKIDIVKQLAQNLPSAPNPSYLLCDSWWVCQNAKSYCALSHRHRERTEILRLPLWRQAQWHWKSGGFDLLFCQRIRTKKLSVHLFVLTPILFPMKRSCIFMLYGGRSKSISAIARTSLLSTNIRFALPKA